MAETNLPVPFFSRRSKSIAQFQQGFGGPCKHICTAGVPFFWMAFPFSCFALPIPGLICPCPCSIAFAMAAVGEPMIFQMLLGYNSRHSKAICHEIRKEMSDVQLNHTGIRPISINAFKSIDFNQSTRSLANTGDHHCSLLHGKIRCRSAFCID